MNPLYTEANLPSLDKHFTNQGKISKAFIDLGINNVRDAVKYVHGLDYGRNTARRDLLLVLSESKGTCSSKHALIKALAEEISLYELKLIMVIFKMNPENTPLISGILKTHHLEYIPEAHCFLSINNQVLDITFPNEFKPINERFISYSEEIEADQVVEYKPKFHIGYLKEWIKTQNLKIEFETLWEIRNECIRQLSIQ